MRRAALALAATLALAGAGAAPAATLDYLHVEANSGGSSGGHAALRLGERVFDFQHGDGGTLRLRRSSWEAFRQRTAVRGNRTIHAARVELPDADHARLLAAFEERHLVWSRHFRVQEELAADRRLLELLLAGEAPPPIEGAGLFAPGAAPAGETSALLALRERIARERGKAFLSARLRALEAQLAALAPAAAPPLPPPDPARLPRAPSGFAERHRDLAQRIAALRVLARTPPLHADALRRDPLPLDGAERAGLVAFADALEARLVALVASDRPDAGLALLVGMARLESARRSVAEGRLRLLDDFPPDAEALPADPRLGRDPYLHEQRDAAAARLAWARERLRAGPPLREAEYDALEEAGNDVLELDAALAGTAPLRLADGERIPAPLGRVADLPALHGDGAALRRALDAARVREREHERGLAQAFGYRLLTRNCVTEIFATLDAALGGEGAMRALGGPAAPPGALRFVPFASFDAVVGAWRVAERWEEPSLRRARIAALRADENDLRVSLRESNALTSTVYRRDPDDPFFVFFSDGAWALRPLLGAANLAASAGWSVLGLARAPFDGGASLRAGVAGALYSLPELAFVSLRKGTMRYGPPAPGYSSKSLPGGSGAPASSSRASGSPASSSASSG